MSNWRPPTVQGTGTSTSYNYGYSTSVSQAANGRRSSVPARPSTGRRSRAGSVIGGGESQRIICAISEGRGVSPNVGMAFVNIVTGEAVLSQICDNQFYARTVNKLQVFEPTEILIVNATAAGIKSTMHQVVEENVLGATVILTDRKYWSESSGLEYIQQLAFLEDVEVIKVAIGGNYFATCCFAAVIKYIDLKLFLNFYSHSLRIKYQPSEGSMMIDLSTIRSLELIQNNQNSKSRDCLFGLMNQTLTPMGSRLLRGSILQPSTQVEVLTQRFDALEEISTREDMFFDTRQALKSFLDIEKLITSLIIVPSRPDIRYAQQSINNILMLKTFLQSIPAVREALTGATSCLLIEICGNCCIENIDLALNMIRAVINDDVTYQKTPLDLRNQRTYAVRSGVCGLLDVARQTFKEATEDVHQHITDINVLHEMNAEIRYDNARRYWLRISESEFDRRTVPEILINQYRKKGFIECQTLDLVKLNQRIEDSHLEVVLMSDKTIQDLLDKVRTEIPSLFRVCESLALLDMITGFGHLVSIQEHEYARPTFADCIAIKSGRHPVGEKVHKEKFVPNDVYASDQKRFQIITGCNMSGKSTYIRSIALMCVMAQVGCFVPAQYASFPVIRQLFARVSMDDSMEANVSTFAAEMREAAFILRNIDSSSLAIVDELGRGTSTRDGLAIALSIAEALVESKAMVWFVTHFRDLAKIMSERPGVVNLHLTVDMTNENTMAMLYKIGEGYVGEEHYGLALARVIGLPPTVLEIAEKVSRTLAADAEAKRKSSKAYTIAKRRKLVLNLREVLKQSAFGSLKGDALLSWLRKLQEEFVVRMEQLEEGSVDGDIDEIDESDESSEQKERECERRSRLGD